jgi:hypothetical protein
MLLRKTVLLLLAVFAASASATSFVDAEVPSGKINGNNNKFTLAHLPNPMSSVAVYRNGIRQRQCPNCNYTANTNGGVGNIVFNACCIPQSGESIVVDYRWEDTTTPGRFFLGSGQAPTSTLNADNGITYNGVLYIDGIDGKLKVLLKSGAVVVLTP